LVYGADIRAIKSGAGNYASYCRCVESKRISNGKKKGENNRKNGNNYLAWAFLEAANHAVNFYPPIKKYYQRKLNKTHRVVALKTIAHKLARASYFIQRDKVDFDMQKAFFAFLCDWCKSPLECNFLWTLFGTDYFLGQHCCQGDVYKVI
jgi:hypothetical protein